MIRVRRVLYIIMKRRNNKAFVLIFLMCISMFYISEQVSANDIKKSSTDQDVTFKIQDTVKKGNILNIKYEIQSKTPVPEIETDNTNSKVTDFVEMEKLHIFVNGKSLNYSGSVSHEKIENNHYKGVIAIKQVEQTIPKNCDLKIIVGNIFGKEGQWITEVPIKE